MAHLTRNYVPLRNEVNADFSEVATFAASAVLYVVKNPLNDALHAPISRTRNFLVSQTRPHTI